MTNKIYDILKFVALVVLPALATLIITIFTIWGLPYGEAIAGTITAVATFLGSILCITSNEYQKREKLQNELNDKKELLWKITEQKEKVE